MERVFEQQARIFKVLGHPLRLKIVNLLNDCELTAGEIVERLGAKNSNTSQHLSLLRWAEIVEARKDGLQVYYKLKFPCVLKFFSCVDNVLNERLKAQKMTNERRAERRRPMRPGKGKNKREERARDGIR